MTVEFRGVSTASLGAMLKGYGVMAGVGGRWPDARFWWIPSGALEVELKGRNDNRIGDERWNLCDAVFELREWAIDRGQQFKKVRGSSEKGVKAGGPPLENPATWGSLGPELARDAEGVGVSSGTVHRSNPVLARWGQDGSGNLFSVLHDAGKRAKRAHLERALFGGDGAVQDRLRKGSGVLFPEGIKRYATGSVWVHESGSLKPLGLWDFILAMRGLLLLRGAVRSFRGSRREYPSFPFVLPGGVVRAQGQPVPTDEVFLPTWNADRPRTLAEFEKHVASFQARVGQRELVSGAAEFRRAIAGRAVTGGFDAFHRFALERRKPGQRSPQRQAVSRGVTAIGPASSASNSLRVLLAPLDDSGWLERFRLRRIHLKIQPGSEKLALAKTRFDESVHAAIDVPDERSLVNILAGLWELQVKLWTVSERQNVPFRPAPLLEAHAWGTALRHLLSSETAARLGWALASLGWVPVTDNSGKQVRKPVVEQLLPGASGDAHGPTVPDADGRPRERVRQPGHNPARELATLFWRRWIDTASLPILPARGTRHAIVKDVTALLRGEVLVSDLQKYFLAFLALDGGVGTQLLSPDSESQPILPAYAALRLWHELSAGPAPTDRRPMDGAVPRGIANGTRKSVTSAANSALRRLRVAGLPGFWSRQTRPTGKSVALPRVHLSSQEAGLMAAAVLVPISRESVDRLAHTLLIPSASQQ